MGTRKRSNGVWLFGVFECVSGEGNSRQLGGPGAWGVRTSRVCACVPACLRACVPACVRRRMHVSGHMCLPLRLCVSLAFLSWSPGSLAVLLLNCLVQRSGFWGSGNAAFKLVLYCRKLGNATLELFVCGSNSRKLGSALQKSSKGPILWLFFGTMLCGSSPTLNRAILLANCFCIWIYFQEVTRIISCCFI